MERKVNQRKTNEDFITESKMIHGDKYIYDKVKYINAHTKVEIFCITCDKYFWQIARDHSKGKGCVICGIKKRTIGSRLTQEEFLKRAKELHGEKYDYSEFVYETAIIKGTIKCNTCNNVFKQDAHHHIGIKKAGCPKCGIKKVTDITRKTLEKFIEESKEIHGDKYNYDKVVYVNHATCVEIYCNKCNVLFQQIPAVHLSGCGCKICSDETNGLKSRLTQEEFLKRVNKIHGDKYNYDKTVYIVSNIKISVLCLGCKTYFEILASHHLNGNGCSRCKFSKGEIAIDKYLKKLELDYEPQKSFPGCRHINLLKFDFYVSKYNLCIEYDGELHYHAYKHFGGEEKLKVRQLRDKIKNDYCEKNKINLLRIKYDENIVDKLNSYFKKISNDEIYDDFESKCM